MPSWAELTKEERAARMHAGKRAAKERRDREAAQAAAAELTADVEAEAAEISDADDELLRETPAEAIAEKMAAVLEGAAERRRRLLGDVDPMVSALFSDEELLKIEQEERDKALLEQKKQALINVRAIARQEARIEHDLIPGDQLRSDAEKARLREKVKIRVTLPGDGAGHNGQNGFRVDGRLLQVGAEREVTRAEFESLREMHYRAHLNEVIFRTLDQHKAGNSAREVLGRTIPSLEVA